MAGLTPEGFVTKRLDEIIDSLKARAASAFGPNINTEDDAVMGQFIDVMAPEFSDIWELSEAVYNGFIPSAAEGAQLDDVASVVGISRQPATQSRVDGVTGRGDFGTIIAGGTIFAKSTDNAEFSTDSAVSIDISSVTGIDISVASVTDLTNYDFTVNGKTATYTSDASATPTEIAAGITSAINTDPMTSLIVLATDNLDDTVTVRTLDVTNGASMSVSANLQADKGYISILSFAVDAGPISAPLGTIYTIVTPVAVLDSVTNEVTPVLGRNLETDTELRLRRSNSLRLAGSSTPDAIRAAVSNVLGVSSVFLVENQTSAVDSGGRPPKSFETIVEGGADSDIAQTIFDNKPAGIATYGTAPGVPFTALDSEGNSVDIYFSRPGTIDIELEIDYSLYTEETPPVGLETAIAEAALAYGNNLQIGTDVIPQRFYGAIYSSAAGIGEIEVRARIAPNPFSTDTIPIAGSDRANFNIGSITVTLVP